jgi:ornithine carbamoyltransferase
MKRRVTDRKRDLISIADLFRPQLEEIMALAQRLKADRRAGWPHPLLAGKTLAMIFEKPSLRTRVTFEVGIGQLGGHAVYLAPQDIGLGTRETVADVAQNLARWVDIIMARTFAHATIVELAQHATVPVINALSDLLHPCQILADCLTLIEQRGQLDGLKVTFVGDGNNVVNSWINAASKFPFHFALACPPGYEPDAEILKRARKNGAQVTMTSSVEEAVRDADAVYTDVWTSMGQEEEREKRLQAFKNYQVNAKVMSRARKNALVMHCLPAHRGEEITAEVLDSPQSVVLEQSENRLHIQKAIMVWLLQG